MSYFKKNKKLFWAAAAISLCVQIPALAYQAPVVDVQPDSNNTQIESVSAGWQNMPAPSAAKDQSEEQPETVGAGNAMPINNENSANLQQVKQQVQNMVEMNLPQQIIDLRQTVAELQGKVQVLTRNLQTITAQQKSFYQDLSTQIAALKKNNVNAPVADATKESNAHVDISQNNTASDNPAVAQSDAVAYKAAFRLLANKHLNQARTAFLAYLKQHPTGRFVPNAYYWLGEIAYAHKAYNDSMTAFETVISQFPKSNKVADAKLKIGMIHMVTGKKDVARIDFMQVKKQYPDSTAAQLADLRLKQL